MSINNFPLLSNAINKYNPKYVIALFSGGHDSLAATHIASQHPQFSFALHIDTGIGIKETRDFVRETCKEWEIELRIYKASEYVGETGLPDPQIYEELVKGYGFPGAPHHTKMYDRLKERPLRLAIRDLKRDRKDKTLLVTGVRATESVRRMKHVEPIQEWEGTKIWVAPIWDWSKLAVGEYIQENELRRNPVVDNLHMSGECLCGAYAKKDEIKEIEFWYPDTAKEIHRLEQIAKDNGHFWKWGSGPPEWMKIAKNGQLSMSNFAPNGYPEMLCMGCEKSEENRSENATKEKAKT